MQSNITKILCPIDFSEPAMKAFEYAQDLATGLNASLLVCHAFDRPATWEFGDQTEPADESIKKRLADLESRMPIERFLHAGLPGKVICWLAAEQGCDLIIMGTHGRTGLRHAIFGSVAEYVLRHATCPVTTIRVRPEPEKKPEEPLVIPLPAPRYL